MIGDMQTVQARIYGEGLDPETMPRADYQLQEALQYKAPPGFVEDYPPMPDYLIQERYYNETFLGSYARACAYGKFFRIMSENENYDRDFITARLWVTMDNFQYQVFMPTGLLCPNLRAYWEYRDTIRLNLRYYYSDEAYERMWNRILYLWENETLFNADECNTPSNFAHGRYGVDPNH